MKTLLKTALALATVFVTANAFAEGNNSKPAAKFAYNAYRSTTNPGKLNVIISKPDAAPVQLRVLDANGGELYRTSIKESALQPLNISQLPSGTYTLEMTRGLQTATRVFVVK